MKNPNLDKMERSNIIYNLSGNDDFVSSHESDSEENNDDEVNNDDADNSDSTDTENDEENNEHIPTTSWFTTEEMNTINVTDNPSDFSNFDPLDDDLFLGQYFVDKQSALNAIQTSHIKNSRNYHVFRSDTT